MKKFLVKLGMAFLPLVLYIIIFVSYEPYNYWGIKPLKSGRWTTPLARVREFRRNPSENIILGDSRMNHFDPDIVEELSGYRYANLSTGGQALNLSRELYDWAKTQTEISRVVIDASFYQVRTGNESPSAQPVFAIAEQPLSYVVTRDYVVEAFDLFWKDVKKRFPTDSAENDSKEIKNVSQKYRDDLVLYATQNILRGCQGYSIGEKQMENIIYITDDTRKNGGIPLIVIPPVQESIWDYVIFPLDLEDELETYKAELSHHAVVYDMEWISDFAKDQDIYADGFHFLGGDGYRRFEKAVFTGMSDFVRIRDFRPEE